MSIPKSSDACSACPECLACAELAKGELPCPDCWVWRTQVKTSSSDKFYCNVLEKEIECPA